MRIGICKNENISRLERPKFGGIKLYIKNINMRLYRLYIYYAFIITPEFKSFWSFEHKKGEWLNWLNMKLNV